MMKTMTISLIRQTTKTTTTTTTKTTMMKKMRRTATTVMTTEATRFLVQMSHQRPPLTRHHRPR
jgi:hypothetical protein